MGACVWRGVVAAKNPASHSATPHVKQTRGAAELAGHNAATADMRHAVATDAKLRFPTEQERKCLAGRGCECGCGGDCVTHACMHNAVRTYRACHQGKVGAPTRRRTATRCCARCRCSPWPATTKQPRHQSETVAPGMWTEIHGGVRAWDVLMPRHEPQPTARQGSPLARGKRESAWM